jgi:3-phytase
MPRSNAVLPAVCLFVLLAAPAAAAQTVSVRPTRETSPARHAGDTADDTCIWIHPTQPELSLIIGDDKDGGVLVWNLDGTERQYLDGTQAMNNIDLRYNVPLTGRFSDGTPHDRVALVGVGNETDSSIVFYKVNPSTRKLEPAGGIRGLGLVPYGSCMYRSPISGKYYYFVNAKSGVTQQWELKDDGSGGITGTKVRQFDVGGQTEGCVADDVLAKFYIGEEAIGVWRYGAEPGDGSSRTQVDRTGSGGNLVADVEGMSIYYTSSEAGYLLVSSQGNSTIVVYTREGNNAFVGRFTVGANGTIDAVTGTDGLDVTNLPLGPDFPKGLFVVHDTSNSGATASNHKLVPWESIANAFDPPLRIDTAWDPRRVGAPSSGDSDGDGLPDSWEERYFGDLDENGAGDPDGDGFTNLEEYAAGSDPTDAASRPGTPAAGGGDDSSSGGCGLTGGEALLAAAGMLWAGRRRARRTLEYPRRAYF